MAKAYLPPSEAVAIATAEFEAAQAGVTVRKAYPDDPVAFIEERLQEHLWSKEREICDAVIKHRRVAVQSAHDTGKSFTASRLVAWWLTEHPAHEAFAVTTAPTKPQVNAILWREIRFAHAKGALPGRVTQTEWYIDPERPYDHYRHPRPSEQLVAYGRKPSDYAPGAFQGIHAKYVFMLLDEACGIPESLFVAADTLTTNEYSRVLAIGNPDDPSSHFAKICRPGSGWHVIKIDGLQSPNFTDEAVPDELRPLLLAPSWVEEKRLDWGEGSPLWISKVTGEFPEDAEDGVIKLSWLRRCQLEPEDDPDEEEDDLDRPPPLVELGVDIGAGGDLTVVRERRDMRAGRTWRERTPEPHQAVSMIRQAIKETGARCVKIDVIGVGWGIAGRLDELYRAGKHEARIVKVNVGAASRLPRRFFKLRDELWWMGRELAQEQAWDLRAVDDDCLAELIAPKYAEDTAGRVKVEKKEDTIARLGHSPDDADALLLAFYARPSGPLPRQEQAAGRSQGLRSGRTARDAQHPEDEWSGVRRSGNGGSRLGGLPQSGVTRRR